MSTPSGSNAVELSQSANGNTPQTSELLTAGLPAPTRRQIPPSALYLVVAIGVFELILKGHNPPPGIVLLDALSGLPYALLGIGLILVYRANRVINFAQAQLGGGAGMLGALLMKLDHVPYLIAIPVALGFAALTGAVSELVFMRRFANAPRLVMMIATIGLSLLLAVLQFVVPLMFDVHPGSAHGRTVDTSPPTTLFSPIHFTLSKVRFGGNVLFMAVVTLAVVAALAVFFRRSPTGRAIRASAENAERAVLMGISVRRLSTIVWVVAAMLSGLAALLQVPVNGVPELGVQVGPTALVYGLAAAIFARMESFPRALVGGVTVGVLTQSVYYVYDDPLLPSAVIVPVMLFVLLAQRGRLSRGEDLSLGALRQTAQFRPIPPELRRLPEVVWGKAAMWLAALAVMLLGPLPLDFGKKELASVVLIYAIVCVSLTILTGWAGQISLGQWGLAGVGAFVTGFLAGHHQADFFVVILASGLAGAAASLIIGLPALRIQGLFLAATTLAFAIAVNVYLLSPNYFSAELPSSVTGVVRPWLFGRYSIDGPMAFYYVTVVALAAALASAAALRHTRAGRAMVGIRDNPRAAQSYGINLARVRITAFAISGFWAAVAGALFVYEQGALDQVSFDPNVSLQLMTIVVIGGVTSLPGALLGAVYLAVLQYGGFGTQAQLLASGVGVLLMLMVIPGGVAQGFYSARDGILRLLAARHHLIVPSLVADRRTATLDEARAGHVHIEGQVAVGPAT